MLEQTNNPLLIDNRHEIIRIIHSLLIALQAHKRRLLPWLQAPASLRITGFIEISRNYVMAVKYQRLLCVSAVEMKYQTQLTGEIFVIS